MRYVFFKWILIFSLLFFIGSESSRAQRNFLTNSASSQQLNAYLSHIDSWRTKEQEYILKSVYQLPRGIKASLVENAEKNLSFEWPNLPATVFLQFSENGNRSHYEGIRGKRRKVLSALVIGELIEGKGRFIHQIVNGIWAICEESTWAYPAHLSLQRKYTPLPNPGENIVDLGDGSTATLLSWTYFLLKSELDKVTPVLASRIRYELEKRVIKPYLDRNDFWWMGFHGQSVNNWNPTVNRDVLFTALLTEKKPERIDSVVYKTMQSVDFFINQYPSDGGCDEGPSYWNMAGGALIAYLNMLQSATGNKIDITNYPLICNMGRYIYRVNIDQNYFVDFADAHPTTTPDVVSVFEFGKYCNSDTLKQFAAWFAKKNGDASEYLLRNKNSLHGFIDYLRIYPSLKSVEPHQPLIKKSWLPELQVLTVRNRGGTPEGLFMAAKGGTNGESHNHNDVGNFIIYKDGKPAIIDIGVGTYTRQTFSKNRYKIFTMQSAWHNLPTINGVMQHAGSKYKASEVYFNKDKKGVHLSMNIAGAYPESAGVASWVRTLDFKNNEVSLSEKYELNKYDSAFFLSLITPLQDIQVKEGRIILNGNLSIVFDPKHFAVKIENKKLTDRSLQHSWGRSLNRILLVDKLEKRKGQYRIKFQESL